MFARIIHGIGRPDFVLLPALAFLTVIACVTGAEFAARVVMPEQLVEVWAIKASLDYRPDCVSKMKAAEGDWATVRYNDCGLRSGQSCVKRPQALRITTLGTSISRGYAVEYREMYAPEVENVLTGFCHRLVDIQNVSVAWPNGPLDSAWRSIGERLELARALRPNLLVLFVSPWDLLKYYEAAPPRIFADQASRFGGTAGIGVFSLLSGIAHYLRELREQSRFVLAGRHFLYRNDEYFLEGYLSQGDASDYLRVPLSSAWQSRLAMFEKFVEPIGAAAAEMNVPLAVIFVPMEQQILLARASRKRDPSIEFGALQRQLASISEWHGWKFIDTSLAFAEAPPIGPFFYRVNGHPTGIGHSLIAKSLTSYLTTGSDAMRCE
jgi:hypothetical protein